VAGMEYFAASKLRFVPGETRTGQAYLYVEYFSDPACTSYLAIEDGDHVSTAIRGEWIDSSIGNFHSGTVAVGKSARLAIQLEKNEGGGQLSVEADDITFAPVGVPLCRGLAATQFGTNGPDVIVGTSGPDVLVGLGGKDVIYGKGGDDVICGGS